MLTCNSNLIETLMEGVIRIFYGICCVLKSNFKRFFFFSVPFGKRKSYNEQLKACIWITGNWSTEKHEVTCTKSLLWSLEIPHWKENHKGAWRQS